MASPPLTPSPITPPDSPGASGDEGGAAGRHRQRHDQRVSYLLRRQLKARMPLERVKVAVRRRAAAGVTQLLLTLPLPSRSPDPSHPAPQAFSSDPGQRQLVLPRALTARDRWRAHLLAEGWGLMHESTGEGAARRLVVWKPSRSRRSLKPAMLDGCCSSGSEGERGGEIDERGESSGSAAGEAGSEAAGTAGSGAEGPDEHGAVTLEAAL